MDLKSLGTAAQIFCECFIRKIYADWCNINWSEIKKLHTVIIVLDVFVKESNKFLNIYSNLIEMLIQH